MSVRSTAGKIKSCSRPEQLINWIQDGTTWRTGVFPVLFVVPSGLRHADRGRYRTSQTGAQYPCAVTRIVGGDLGGRVLLVPPGRGTRPTSERAREGLFNTLAGLVDLRGAAFLDLYAGSGAVGLEAASRGAARVLLVETDQKAAATIKRNASGLAATAARVMIAQAERVAAAPPVDGPYDVVFADPPYRETDERLDALLADLAENGWLSADAVLVVERDRRSREPEWPPGVRTLKSRDYGEATLWYGRRS